MCQTFTVSVFFFFFHFHLETRFHLPYSIFGAQLYFSLGFSIPFPVQHTNAHPIHFRRYPVCVSFRKLFTFIRRNFLKWCYFVCVFFSCVDLSLMCWLATSYVALVMTYVHGIRGICTSWRFVPCLQFAVVTLNQFRCVCVCVGNTLTIGNIVTRDAHEFLFFQFIVRVAFPLFVSQTMKAMTRKKTPKRRIKRWTSNVCKRKFE